MSLVFNAEWQVSNESCHQLLRSQTAPAHSALEALPVMRSMASGTPSIGDYQLWLEAQYAVIAPLEPRLGILLPECITEGRLVKAGWLLQDLLTLSLTPPLPSGSPLGSKVPLIDSFAAAMGAMYVLEGSTLGLQLIKRRLLQQPTTSAAAGYFLNSYGRETGRQWRRFLAHLNTLPESDWQAAATSANAIFSYYMQILAKPGLLASLKVNASEQTRSGAS